MEKIKYLFQSASIPCISNISKSHLLISKLTWLISFILLFAIFVMFARETSLNYFEHEVITNVDIIREEESEFATVSFCINQRLNLSQFLEGCFFDMQECDWSDFEVNDFLNETCYRFNSGRNYYNETTSIKSISRYGPETGLVVLFKIKDFYYDIYDDFKVQFKTAIFIQNQSSLFRRDHAYNLDTGFYAPSGLSHITIEREFIQKLPAPHSECRSNSDYFIFPPNKTYQQKDCLDLCFEKIILQKCNCTNSNEQSIKDCLNNNNDESKSKCIGEQLRTFIMNKDKDLFQFCLKKCPI